MCVKNFDNTAYPHLCQQTRMGGIYLGPTLFYTHTKLFQIATQNLTPTPFFCYNLTPTPPKKVPFSKVTAINP